MPADPIRETTICPPGSECSDPGSEHCRCHRNAGHREMERIRRKAEAQDAYWQAVRQQDAQNKADMAWLREALAE